MPILPASRLRTRNVHDGTKSECKSIGLSMSGLVSGVPDSHVGRPAQKAPRTSTTRIGLPGPAHAQIKSAPEMNPVRFDESRQRCGGAPAPNSLAAFTEFLCRYGLVAKVRRRLTFQPTSPMPASIMA